MTRSARIGLALLAALLGGPALAQGMPGSTVGLTATGLPSNPFASNYPSEPPQVEPLRRGPAAARPGSIKRRATAARRPGDGLRPPADIPAARPTR